ncbi:DNA-binding ATP-dependent protease La [uncultured Desulfobacterium sp.]|uniref:Lon protease n=1 Tax=uncultured Desulfobacterium sp. TaxID=201089 RepID=A0A445MRE1_9BACT|nr:DNA-binding ATP-dependent protease La [uncultured Desulfobacterium sp.]
MFNSLKKDPHNLNDEERYYYPLLPLRDVVVFPNMVVPLFVGRDKSIKALEYAMSHQKEIFLAAQKDAKVDDPSPMDIYLVGTLGMVLQLLKLPDGTVKALIEGKERGKIENFVDKQDFFMVEVKKLKSNYDANIETVAIMRSISVSFEEYAKLNEKIGQEIVSAVTSIEDPVRLADTVAGYLTMKGPEKQKILELEDLNQRLEGIYSKLVGEIDILKLEQRLRKRVKKQMEKTQKDYYLNEQMRAIHKEMGTQDSHKAELDELEKKIKQKKLSKEAHVRVKQEFKKLKMMSPMSAEATVVRNYIDWIISLPWHDKTRVKLDIKEAEDILNEDHYGLDKPKERILEYLAVQSLTKKIKGPILCLVGPPGVGKTSLARSVARATGRNFIRLSLGGVRDEAEIRGHRRTYIGALPGKVIQYLKKAKSTNPVFCLDEVDKMSTDFRGDPSAALLEVLDPEQNCAFNDHYLDLDYDLSEVFFITTANNLHSIPLPLQDRMEIIRLPGYTELEKLNIAKQFLVKKQVGENGLKLENISFSDTAILTIIRNYTREAGVRNLEREISSICRKVAREVVRCGENSKIAVSAQSVNKYLGVPKYRYGRAEEKDLIGVATGLAWTEFGGELLQTETTIMPGKGNLSLTGKLGEVMQESAKAAISYVRSRARQLRLPDNFYEKVDIHVHVPEGAIPKDGPSAGITIATTIISALLRKPVNRDIAMTGEITLRGSVLPIGGLKEKILAAHRGMISKVLIPMQNKKDIDEIPKKILKKVELVLVENMDEVLKNALVLEKGEELFAPEGECQTFSIKELMQSQEAPASAVTAH